MLQAYQGYIQGDGRFVADNPSVKLPTKRKAIVTILNDEYVQAVPANSKKQKDALHHLYNRLRSIDDEPIDEAFDSIVGQRFDIGRELDL